MNGFTAPDEEVTQSSSGFIAPDEETTQWSDIGKNIVPDAKGILQGNLATAERIGKGIMDIPSDVVETGKEELSGKSPFDTPIAQDVKTVGGGVLDAVKGIPQQLENLASKDAWIQHPVQNALTAGSLVAPMLAPETEGMAASIGKSIENKGGNLAADIADVSGKTVQRTRPEILGEDAQAGIRKAGNIPNVADVRTEVGKGLVNKGVVGGIGQDVGDRLQKVNEGKDIAGKDINSLRDEIRKVNRNAGEYENVDDPIHVQANPILKKVLDIANELRDSARSGIKQTSRFWRETYNSLAKKAEANGGRLTLDDIHTEMQDVGKDMNSPPNSPRFNTASDIYSHLAQTQEEMLQDFSKEFGRKDIVDKLVDANRRYTHYSKLANDLTNPAASGEVGGAPNPQRALLRGSPVRATLYAGVRAIKPALAEALVKGGSKFAKYGGYLEAAARQGPRNLAIADFLIKQKDQDYAASTP